MDIALPAVLGTLVMTVMNFIKYLRATDWNGVLTQLAVWLVGLGTTVIAAHSDMFGQFVINNAHLSDTNGATQALIGLVIGSVASQFTEALKAIDQFRSSSKPRLVDAVDDKVA